MSLEQILTAVVNTIRGVHGSGVVRDYEMFVSDKAGLKSHFTHQGLVNACEVDRASTHNVRRTAGKTTDRDHEVKLYFYYSVGALDQTHRRSFRGLIERVEAAFRDDITLGDTVDMAGPLVIHHDGFIEKCGMLLHFAECSLSARLRVS